MIIFEANFGKTWNFLDFHKCFSVDLNFHLCTILQRSDWDQKHAALYRPFFEKIVIQSYSVYNCQNDHFWCQFWQNSKFSECLSNVCFEFSFVHCITIILETKGYGTFRPLFPKIYHRDTVYRLSKWSFLKSNFAKLGNFQSMPLNVLSIFVCALHYDHFRTKESYGPFDHSFTNIVYRETVYRLSKW